jgi:lysophospholipase L1-like esterase
MKKIHLIIVISLFLLVFGVVFSVKAVHLPAAVASVMDFGKSKVNTPDKKEIKVTALGDSLAYGVGDTNDNGYTGDVKKRYEKQSDKTLIVHDFGVPDDTSTDLINRLQNDEIIETAKHSDMIFINIGTNDFLKSTDHLSKFDTQELKRNEKIYKKNLNHILNTVQDTKTQVPVYILGIYNPKVKGTDMSTINQTIESWNETTKQVTKSHKNVIFVRTDDLFLNKNKNNYFSDILHPNQKGYALIGKRVYDTMKQDHR